ncbi:GFA family protein [Marinicella sp. W31]|uniref:GFA family protein n=1 Tax=Marinicella sp. W31 TaxID=3023713 RepID=UPI00375757A1
MTKALKQPLTGRCLCGGIVYEVDLIQPKMSHCHCQMCRRFHGAAFATYGEAKPEHFRWVQGESLLSEYQAENQTTRRFCKKCGSSMTFQPAHNPKQLIEFALATLDGDIPNRPDVHIFTDYKASWFTITDDLPRHSEGRNSPLNN